MKTDYPQNLFGENMIKSARQAPRPANMSQLDYLWSYFGSYSVSEEVNTETPREDVILTEAALVNYVKEATDGIFSLELRPKVGEEDILQLVGKSYGGGELSIVELDKEDHLVSINKLLATQVEVDNNIASTVGEYLLVFTMFSGKKVYANLSDFQYIGQESKSAKIIVKDNKIVAQVKIDNPIIEPTVELKETDNGIQANLLTSLSESGVQLVKTEDGIKLTFPWEDTTTEIKLKYLTHDQYLLTTTDPGTIYFITDQGYMYFAGVKYGEKCNITPEELQQLKESVDSMSGTVETLSTEVGSLEAASTKLRTDLDYESGRALEAESNINKELERRVVWDESKTKITLPSGGQLTGIKYNSDPDDPENGATIAQLSQYNKMDFGSPKFPLNLNTPDGIRPTVQEASQTGEQAHQIAYVSDLEGKVDKVEGKGLSTEDFTTEDKTKLSDLSTSVEDLTTRVAALEGTSTMSLDGGNEIEELQSAVSDIQVRLAKIEQALAKVL